MLNTTNLEPGYSGIYQENIIFEENIQDLIDQEEWEDGDEIYSPDQSAFILPSQDEAEA